MVEVGEYYRHYKGNLYRVIGVAKNTETEEYLVIYTDKIKLWARPLKMFEEYVEKDGKMVKRFELEKQIWQK